MGTSAVLVEQHEGGSSADDEAQLFRMALGAASAVAWVWDVPNDVLSWLGDVTTLYGLESTVTSGPSDTFIQLVHLDDRERVMNAVGRSLAHGVDYEVDYRSVSTDGSVRWHRTKGTTVTDADGIVTRMLGVATDISDRRRAEERLAYLASHDQLTGLSNRASLTERLAELLSPRIRPAGTLAVYFLDLDCFKQVNDRFGHEAGDQVLKATAQRLRAALRSADTISRLGGDEFVVVAQVRDAAEAAHLASRIAAAVSHPHRLDGTLVTCPASVGLRLATPASTPAALLREADAAMYAAKIDNLKGGPLGGRSPAVRPPLEARLVPTS